jgi:DNA-binding transcriptional ArsR family regulator
MDAHPVFVALSNPRRTQLLELLSLVGTASVSELTTQGTLSRQAVLKQLDLLRKARLVETIAGHRGIRLYRVRARTLRDVAADLVCTANRWEHPPVRSPHDTSV